MIMVGKFLFNFSNFCVIVRFLTKLLTLGILFSTAVNAVFATKLLTSGILFSKSVSFAFLIRLITSGIFFCNYFLSVRYLVFNTKSLVSILFTFSTNLSYAAFLTTSLSTTSLRLLKSTRTGTNLSMSNLSTSFFKQAKFVFSEKIEVSTCVTFFKHFLLHN